MNTFAASDDHPARRMRGLTSNAPDFYWFYVLLLGVCTCGFFIWFWEIYLSIWSRRQDRRSKAATWYAGGLAVLFLEFFLSSLWPFLGLNTLPGFASLWLLSLLTMLSFLVAGRIELSQDVENHIAAHGLGNRVKMNTTMSLVLGGIYFQYQLRRARLMQAGLL